ncbi:NAD-dependent epimerase/dehydratase family protein [Bacteroides caecigallinarum]|uniref:NAD-dependent epimerase/dehydratase family protein n=1 Tax=Bacteroides caecigallinarum TaxID=1411144 RepID=UPI001F3C1684|nr:NAD(P)-dependent oxidoreductase [Bacteroides caecigallinarum]MCF2552852.1 NAD(P)-dependent oxidoreductase [Bacteroides caecigallinarum]
MNYIITGGTGFIGTHLANLIKEQDENAQVWNLDIVDPEKLDHMTDLKEIEEYTTIKQWKSPVKDGERRKSTFVYCDVRKPIENLPFTPTPDDIIFNFAAVHRTPGHPDHAYFETNIRGAENVCAFAEKHGIKKIVFTSSIAPYGAAEELKEETTLPTPNTPYGISKLVAEKIHTIWQAKNEKERQLTIVRPGVVFGKGENGNFTRLYWAIKGHKFAYPGRKDTIKACIYVKELVRFMLYRLENHDEGVELYNCCFEPAYTIQHIVESMKKVTGLTSAVLDIPNWVIMPAATVIGALGAPMGICPARVKKLQISTNICGKKLKNSGYQFKWTFEEALNDWFEDNDRLYLK